MATSVRMLYPANETFLVYSITCEYKNTISSTSLNLPVCQILYHLSGFTVQENRHQFYIYNFICYWLNSIYTMNGDLGPHFSNVVIGRNCLSQKNHCTSIGGSSCMLQIWGTWLHRGEKTTCKAPFLITFYALKKHEDVHLLTVVRK